MKRHRVHGQSVSYQHLISRAIERRFIFDYGEKRKFRQIMRKQEDGKPPSYRSTMAASCF